MKTETHESKLNTTWLTKPHGTTLRLTPAGEIYLERRLTELCAQGIPGPELTAILNQEVGLNWTLQAYFQRAQELGVSWTPAKRLGRHLMPIERLPEDQRQACYEDPAWEARNGWTDRLVCRECFCIFRDGAMDGKNGHLWLMHDHMTRAKYRLHNPGAPIFTFERIATQSRVDVQEHMAKFAANYATPQERRAADADPKYEARNRITKYVICRMPRCGFKATSGLTKHLKNVHGGKSAEDYRRDHKWPEIASQQWLARWSDEVSKRQAELKAKAARVEQAERIIADNWRPDGWDDLSELSQTIGNKLLRSRGINNPELKRWLRDNGHECPSDKTIQRIRHLVGQALGPSGKPRQRTNTGQRNLGLSGQHKK